MTFSLFLEMFAVPIFLFVGLSLSLKGGAWIRLRELRDKDAETSTEGLGALDGAIFGLMGLLLAFAFSGASARFDERRHLIVEEANCIGTAYLRLELLPVVDQSAAKGLLRQYLGSRLQTYEALRNHGDANAEFQRSQELQSEIWSSCVASAGRSPNTAASMLLLPALNEMFDITTTRSSVALIHPPMIIFCLLVIVLLLCAALAGYRTANSARWGILHKVSFVSILSITYYIILDLEYPRLGFIRVDDFDQVLYQLQDMLK